MAGNESRGPFLDHRHHLRHAGTVDAEIAMKTLVIGAGKSGVAAANFLAARGDEVLLTDSNANPNLPYPLHENVARAFGTQDASLLDGIGTIVLSPGVPRTIPLLQAASLLPIPV